MSKNARTIPLVCLSFAMLELLTGRLKLSREFLGCETITEDGQVFTIFRHIKTRKAHISEDRIIFVVKFKFAHLSHQANKLVSIIPMLLIAGFPGFVQKLYAVNTETGYWQGMYEWGSLKQLEAYKKSFVYRMMNQRAVQGTVQEKTISNSHIAEQLLFPKT